MCFTITSWMKLESYLKTFNEMHFVLSITALVRICFPCDRWVGAVVDTWQTELLARVTYFHALLLEEERKTLLIPLPQSYMYIYDTSY